MTVVSVASPILLRPDLAQARSCVLIFAIIRGLRDHLVPAATENLKNVIAASSVMVSRASRLSRFGSVAVYTGTGLAHESWRTQDDG